MGLALCVIAAGKTTAITAAAFTLSWTHSVEKTEWLENWRVTPAGLELTEARVQGSGAGMDPGEGARLEDGWWVWSPDGPVVPELVLAASGATLSAWRLCHAGWLHGAGLQGRQAGADFGLRAVKPVVGERIAIAPMTPAANEPVSSF